jgi:hypothetical protein
MIKRIAAGLLFLTIFGLIMAQIWGWGMNDVPIALNPGMIAIVILVIWGICHWRTLAFDIGLWPVDGNWKNPQWYRGTKEMFVAVGLAWLVLFIVGFVTDPSIFAKPDFVWLTLRHPFEYYPRSILLQVLLSALAILVFAAFRSTWLTVVAVGLAFGVACYPNTLFVVVEGYGGALTAYFFLRRSKNLWLLAAAQSLLSTAPHHFLSNVFHYGFRVGAAYYSFRL